MEVRVLGPVELVAEDGPVPLRALKQRRLLSALVVHAGEGRSADLLIDAVWGPSPPASAAKLLQTYISQLRKALPAPARIRTLGAGYALELEDESLDAARFERLLAQGRAASREGNPALAASLLRRGLGLWRGRAYADFAYEEFARAEAERLEELRLVALEERIEAELALGRHDDLLPELRSLAAEEPFRERLQAQAMLALYRCGRQSEALEIYTGARARLRDELGLEPGAELRELQRRILQQDPALAAAARAGEALTTLPIPPNALLGRERELGELRQLLVRDDVRLLVLTGAGGSGKTRLALQAARETAESFANGAAFVGLAPLRDPGLVVTTIARALGVAEKPHEALLETLAEALRPRELLLLIDNAEHVRDAAPAYTELLARAPRLTLLVTSRAVLHLSGEHVYSVEPLAADAAIALFLERAREAESRFNPDPADEQAIRRICERLEGLPLAIELAASRVRTLTPGELHARLDPRLPLLTGGPRDAPERQRTLQATIDWSYELLDDAEKQLFARLAVFAGGCKLEAAENVCDADIDTLQSLVEKNLLRRDRDRYVMLETIREYALERLVDSEEQEVLNRRHAEYFRALVDALGGGRHGGGGSFGVLRGGLAGEHDNLRAAMRWSIDAQEPRLAVGLAAAFGYVVWHINVAEGRRWLGEALTLDGPVSPEVRAWAFRMAGNLAREAGDDQAAVEFLERSVAELEALGESHEVGYTLVELAQAKHAPGTLGEARGLYGRARRLFEDASDTDGVVNAMHNLGELELQAGDVGKAKQLFERALSITRDESYTAMLLQSLGDVSLEENDFRRAEAFYRDSLKRWISWRPDARRAHVYCLAGLSAAAAASGDGPRAGRLWGAVERIEDSTSATLQSSARSRYERRLHEPGQNIPGDAVEEGRAMTPEAALVYAFEPGG